jgi:hypothetical protein
MSPIIRNVIAVFIGVIVGMLVNGGIISASADWVPLPEGVDPNDIESIKANFHLYEAKHFLMPFIAHALGTLVGAFVAALVAATHKMKFAIVIGGVFMVGGIMMALLLKGPLWFILLDLILAYIPMAWIGGKLARA